MIVRCAHGLEHAISVTVVDPRMGDDGWVFRAEDPDPIFADRHVRKDVHDAGRQERGDRPEVQTVTDDRDGIEDCQHAERSDDAGEG